MFGFKPSSRVPGLDELLERVHPEDRSTFQESFNKMTRGQEPAALEFRTNPELLPVRYFSPTWQCIRDFAGKPVGYEGTLLDITGRKQSEEKIRETSQHFQVLVEQSLTGISPLNLSTITFIS